MGALTRKPRASISAEIVLRCGSTSHLSTRRIVELEIPPARAPSASRESPSDSRRARMMAPTGAPGFICLSMTALPMTVESLKADKAPIRRVSEVLFGDENIAAAVAVTFVRSDQFWGAVARPDSASTLAQELVPCEGAGRDLVCSYITGARDALRSYSGAGDLARDHAGLCVVQLGLQMVWGEGDPPLTSRRRRPHLSQVDLALETLERTLSCTCAMPGCDRQAQSDAYVERRRASARAVCCKDHEPLNGRLSRRRVRDLLATAMRTVQPMSATSF